MEGMEWVVGVWRAWNGWERVEGMEWVGACGGHGMGGKCVEGGRKRA